jgi:chaperonin GroEL
VGGATEVEVKEKKDRVDDAMHATKAAVEEGIVAGGGPALLTRCVRSTGYGPVMTTRRSASRSCAVRCRRRCARSPRTAASTARVVAGKMLDQKDSNYGFDAQKGEYADLVKTGIIDPVKGRAHRATGRNAGFSCRDIYNGDIAARVTE